MTISSSLSLLLLLAKRVSGTGTSELLSLVNTEQKKSFSFSAFSSKSPIACPFSFPGIPLWHYSYSYSGGKRKKTEQISTVDRQRQSSFADVWHTSTTASWLGRLRRNHQISWIWQYRNGLSCRQIQTGVNGTHNETACQYDDNRRTKMLSVLECHELEIMASCLSKFVDRCRRTLIQRSGY